MHKIHFWEIWNTPKQWIHNNWNGGTRTCVVSNVWPNLEKWMTLSLKILRDENNTITKSKKNYQRYCRLLLKDQPGFELRYQKGIIHVRIYEFKYYTHTPHTQTHTHAPTSPLEFGKVSTLVKRIKEKYLSCISYRNYILR